MTQIDLKSLVKPKFQIGDTVFVRTAPQSSDPAKQVKRVVITAWKYTVHARGGGGAFSRGAVVDTVESLDYYVDGDNSASFYEHQLFTTPADAFGLT